jgi:curved DNA-binding protein CbpA
MSTPSPTATGTFGKNSVPSLLVSALDRRLEGTLVVEHAGERSAIRFAAGSPIKVKLAEPAHLLGDVLVDLGHLTPDARDRGVTAAREQAHLTGFVLVSLGAASAERVQYALAVQVMRRLDYLATLPAETVYGYYQGHDFLAPYGGPRGAEEIDPLAAIWYVVRRRVSDAQVDASLARLAGRPLRLHRASRPARFAFDATEAAVVDVLRAKTFDLPGLLATGLVAEDLAKRLVYVLALTRHLDLGSATPPLGVKVASPEPPALTADRPRPRTAPQPQSATASHVAPKIPGEPRDTGFDAAHDEASGGVATAELTPEHAAFRDDLLKRAETIGGHNYYEILDVDAKADAGSIRSAFFQLAKLWHPDRLPRALVEHKGVAAKIFSRMTEAHQVLSNEEQRREYDQLMKEGAATSDEQEQVQRILRAATAFQKAEVFARKGNMAEAEREALFAFENDGEQPEYGAFYADLLSRQPGRTQFDDLIKMVNNAKKAAENNLRIRLYRARVLQRAGQTRAAFAEYQHVAQADPRSVEAVREVRLYRMRQGQSHPDPKKTGPTAKSSEGVLNQDIGQLFGKLFKR